MRISFWFILFIGFVLNTGVLAQLDTTFGSAGSSIIIYGSLASTDDMVIQPDNKIVLVSSCSNINFSSVPFCAVRLNENGSFDNGFGSNNPIITSPGVYLWPGPFGTGGGVRGVVIQGDGKVVAVGYRTGDDTVLVRFNSNGTVDTAFGSGGMVITDAAPGTNDQAEKVAIQPDGKIVVVGTAGNALFAARYLPGGTLDGSFGTGGISRTVISGNSAGGRSLALQPDGKIVAGGLMSGSYLLIRLNSDGTPDVTWDGDGVVSIPYSGGNSNGFTGIGIRSVVMQADGRVVALGHSNMIYRFNADGSPDTSFDGDGSRSALIGSDKETYSATISASGHITVVGATYTPGGHGSSAILRYFIARYNPDGSPDTTFSDDGYFDINPGGGSAATAVATDPIGRVVIAGVSAVQSTPSVPWQGQVFSAARLVGPPVVVAISGRVTDSNGLGVRSATVKTEVGGTVITARTNAFGYYNLPGVMTGQTYFVSVSAKGHRFTSQTVFVGNQFVTVDFIGQ